MKYPGVLILIGGLLVEGLWAQGAVLAPEAPEAPAMEAKNFLPKTQSGVAVGGGIWGRYLQLDLRPWTDSLGRRMDRENLFYYGGRMVVSGPLRDGRPLRWRFGGSVGAAGQGSDDVGDLNLGLIAAGLTSGLSWRPGKVGVSLDLSFGGAVIDTEIKRAEFPRDWDLYERRTVGLFFWEPILSFDIQVLDIFIVRLQGGYTFLYGRGKEVGGPTAGLALDFGPWM